MKKVVSLTLILAILFTSVFTTSALANAASAKGSIFFSSTSLQECTFNSIKVKFFVENDSDTKVIALRTQIRKQGETKWANFNWSCSKSGDFSRVSLIALAGNCKYAIADGTAYEVRAIAITLKGFYYSDPVIVNTPERTSISCASLSASSIKATGSNIAVAKLINIRYNGVKLEQGTDYMLSVKYVKRVGRYVVKVTGLGAFKGTRKTTVTVCPTNPTLNSCSYNASKKTIKLNWNRVSDCTKQQVAISTSSSFVSSQTGYMNVGQSKNTLSFAKFTLNGKSVNVKTGQTYYIRMRALKVVNGETLYSAWGSAKVIKCK